MSRMTSRMQKEVAALERSPPFGIACWPRESQLNRLDATIQGTAGTPFEGGTFSLEITIPDQYPLEPPRVRFTTKIYHPNVDVEGRICLDTLVMPPKGVWRPSISIATILISIQQLLNSPNGDDGLDADITAVYLRDYERFATTAREWTKKYARINNVHTLQDSLSTAEQLSNTEEHVIPSPTDEQMAVQSVSLVETKKRNVFDDDSSTDESQQHAGKKRQRENDYKIT